jgi:hypothetical protein
MRLNHSRLAAAANPINPFCLFTGKFSKAFFLLPAICWLLAAQGLHAQTTWYVNAAAAPGGNGTSWASAYQSLQQALTAASSGHKIWVAEGTYNNGSFVMKNGVEILGGFPNTGDPGLGDRDWMAHVTTLSGGTNVIHNNFTVGSPLTGTAVLDGFTITGGAGGANGGGMFNQYASPTVRNCVFSGNSALQGAGMYNLNSSSPTVTNCVFSDNTCNGPGLKYGGGMCNVASSPTVTNCLFTNNLSADYGGGLYNELNADPLVLNCTFSANSGYSAVHNRYAGCNPTIKNCIVWGNTGGITDDGASSTVTYSIVQGGFAGTGNLNVDPLFVSSTDFHLQNNSPARGAATSAGAPATDFDGDARPQSGGYDMGYDEVVPNCPAPGTIWYVNAAAAPDGNGASWDCAFQDVQLALAAASSGHKIWVAEGTYKPTSGTDRTISFVMKNGVEILGGFPNTGDPDLGDRDWVAHVTTLSGDVGAGNADSYHVIFNNFTSGSPLTSTAKLDGFTITGGNANGASANGNGGGMSNVYASPSVTNCTFSGNNAAYGGGMINNNYSAPSVTNCTFSGNTTSQYGAGMQNSTFSSPTVSNCTFSGNTATEYGGGMFNQYNSNPTVTNSTFLNNSTKYGGGMFSISCYPIVARCTFSGNSAINGGGMANYLAIPAVTNCHFSGNSASASGGGMINDNASAALVKSCSFSGNTATAAGGAMYNLNAGSPSVVNSILWGNSTEIVNSSSTPTVTYSIVQGGYAGTGNLNVDPLFVSQPPIGLGTTGDLHLQVCSPAIDAGTSAGAPATDLDGNARPFNAAPNVAGNYDMGAYEYQQALPAPTATCQNITVQLDANFSVTVTGAQINDGSTGCGALSYKIDGQASRTFNCADIGVNTVTLTVTDAFNNTDDCSATITVADDDNPLPVVTAPTVTQPTCVAPTGTIFVNASGGGTLEYSVDNGSNWDLDETFAGLAPGSYHIKVRLEANQTCETTYASNPVVLVSPFTASTTTDTWTGCVSTDWHTAGNWADGSVPTTAENVIIPNVANDPVIMGGTTAVAKSVLVQASAVFTIQATGSLDINGSTGFALENYGILDNSGTLRIGNVSSVANRGIVHRNGGTLNNKPGGLIQIDRTSAAEAFYTSGIVNNEGSLEIGSVAEVTGHGITVEGAGTFNNKTDGLLTVNRSTAFAVENYGTLENMGTIRIGNITSVANRGIVHRNGGTLNNKPDGLIQIDRTSVAEAFYTSGVVNNEGTLEIGSIAAVTGNGVTVDGTGTFNNQAGGLLTISLSTNSGIQNSGAFNNNACATVTVFDNLNNAGTFTNAGLMTVNTAQAHTNSALTNNGIIEYPVGNPIPNVTNNEIVIAPTNDDNCDDISPAFILGSPVNYNILGVFTDAAATNSAGTYTVATNTFTPTAFLPEGEYNYFVKIEDPVAMCTRIASWKLSILNCCIPPIVTAPTVTQPTCALPTGTIFVNASGGGTLEYSVDNGSNWDLDETFAGLAPGSYHIKVRLEANQTCETAYAGNPVVLVSPFTASTTTDTWTGCVSTDWATAGNWADGSVPTTADDVNIPNVTNDPIISAAAVAKSIQLQTSAMLTNNSSLTVNGFSTFPPFGSTTAVGNRGTVENNGTLIIGNVSSAGYWGLYNVGTFNNNADGQITIDRSTDRGLYNQTAFGLPGIFNNTGGITIGGAAGVGATGLFNNGTFTNNATGTIVLDRATDGGLGAWYGTFTNAGSITIGGTVSTGSYGLENVGTFHNNAGGQITIDRSTSFGLYVNQGTFNNAGGITIGGTAAAGTEGMRNLATFNNNAGGQITIDRSTTNGIRNSGTVFNNAGNITIGSTVGNGQTGIFSSAQFNNNAGGQITIDRSTSIGLWANGPFTNADKIYIGQTAGVGGTGLISQNTFNNNAGGIILIDRCTTTGLINQNTFNNAATITIGATASVGATGIQNTNSTTFNNSGCTAFIRIASNALSTTPAPSPTRAASSKTPAATAASRTNTGRDPKPQRRHLHHRRHPG